MPIKLKRKKVDAYKKLFFQFHGRLVLFANTFTGDMQVSQDLVQDAFAMLWEKFNAQTKIESPKAYLFQAVRNACLNHQRHLKIKYTFEGQFANEAASAETSNFSASDDPLLTLLELELENKVDHIVNAMSDKCRQAYKMSRQDFLKNKKIAEELGISEKMVEKHITKALSILRSELSNYLGFLLLAFLAK